MTPHRFPRTPHLAWLAAEQPREDKVLSESERLAFLGGEVAVEEKIDGTNLGLCLDSTGSIRIYSRRTLVKKGTHPQFGPLWTWLAAHEDGLRAALGSDLTLYGEWCFAVHSVRYDRLPDWFLGFDVYDRRADGFWSVERRDELLRSLGIAPVPSISRGRFRIEDLVALLERTGSRVGSQPIEGLYLRRERPEWLVDRAKLVRAEFVESIDEHWSKRIMERNSLAARSSVE